MIYELETLTCLSCTCPVPQEISFSPLGPSLYNYTFILPASLRMQTIVRVKDTYTELSPITPNTHTTAHTD